MKIKIERGQVHHNNGEDTSYIELEIGYDFNSNIKITVRKYPKNTHFRVYDNGEDNSMKVIVPNEKFDILEWMENASHNYHLMFSQNQMLEIMKYGKALSATKP